METDKTKTKENLIEMLIRRQRIILQAIGEKNPELLKKHNINLNIK